MLTKARRQKAERIKKIVAHLFDRAGKKKAGNTADFIRLYFERVAPEDINTGSVENLYGAAMSLKRFAEQRKPGAPKIRIFNPKTDADGWQTGHTVIEIVNDDMPFLVDSVTHGLNRAGYTVDLAVHPILRVKRTGAGRLSELATNLTSLEGYADESWMHVEITAQTSAAALKKIEDTLVKILSDVRAAVEDWKPMLAKLHETITTIKLTPPPLDMAEVKEATAFLDWLADNHFTLLGVREYEYSSGKSGDRMSLVKGSGQGILRNPNTHVLESRTTRIGAAMTDEVRHLMRQPTPLFVTKANVRSTVHRNVHMDYIGVKSFDQKGRVIGERRFIGLFTSAAYNQSPLVIPLLRRKVSQAIEKAGVSHSSHDGKALSNILETFPRDELFQISQDDLHSISFGVLELQERPRIRSFARRDPFGRFVACLVYVPREQHSTDLRKRFGEIIAAAFGGHISAYNTHVGESPLARIQFIVGANADSNLLPEPGNLEQTLREAARSWSDDLKDALVEHAGDARGNALWKIYGEAFPAGYRATFAAAEALSDVDKMAALDDDANSLELNLYRPVDAPSHTMRFKIFHAGKPISLSDCLPILENMGLRAIDEQPHLVDRADTDEDMWIHDFGLEEARGETLNIGASKEQFQETFARVWAGQVENDGFNRLVMRAGLSWRGVVIVRAYSKYLRQAGIAFSREYMEATLAGNPDIARLLVDLFETRFDPALGSGAKAMQKRAAAAKRIVDRITKLLDQVVNLDEDRILRRFLNLITCTLRTNYFQPAADGAPKSYISFKLNSQEIDELPLPRPHVEIWVYSARVEAVHLRGGRVARGGLRWSDRREDFRTEVLGLMKAQMVKNAVIVPVGAKGGFVTKRLPESGSRDDVMAEVITCYKTFISGLLDVTDNQVAGGIAHPAHVVRYDDTDTYLVVAADKGTATFSDIANGVAIDYGFWLGDAFASGGSVGYDHKGMGITARGAWESVKRHFREVGIDTQSQDFSVVGIGDMGGDVFGNGMLLSKHICLLGAFNHLHIFIDPTPDAAKSWPERKRLFDTPGTAWTDYNAKLISKGGGIFERKAKSIPISAQMKACFGIRKDSLTPNELMRAMVMADVDLLWNGGIGTYVKASSERDAEVGDRANDALRVDGNELQCKVIGEGGNLGMTQRGRIEYAQSGGRVNTDAIDNSAGVDCSDHEVNIKILIDSVVAEGDLTVKQRNRVLAQMTDEVGLLVLRTNYVQTQSMTTTVSRGMAALEEQGRFMRALERQNRLDREIEFLPNDEDLQDRLAGGQGLTRPEFAVVQSYAKMTLYEDLLAGNLPQDEYFSDDLITYFPTLLRRKFPAAISGHSLRSEIVVTLLANSIVNRAGATFVNDVMEETGSGVADIGRAFAVARGALDFRAIWQDISALDNKVSADVQTEMNVACEALVRNTTMWFLTNIAQPMDITETINTYAPGLSEIARGIDDLVGDLEASVIAETTQQLIAGGVPKALAARVAGLEAMRSACHIVNVANTTGRSVSDVARIYFATGAYLGLDWLRVAAEQITPDSHWERMAVSVIVEDLYGQQRALTMKVMAAAGRKKIGLDAVAIWAGQNDGAVERGANMIAEFRASGAVDMSQLALANRQVRAMIVG